jgi:hypothetical protein
MRAVRLAAVAVAALVVGGRYLRERARLRTVERLSGRDGLRYLQVTRARSDRAMAVVTALLVAGAIAAVTYMVLGR